MNFAFLPTEVKFYDYFERASNDLVEGALLLQKLFDNTENLDEKVAQITEIEHQGDFIVHEVTNLLVTKIQRLLAGQAVGRRPASFILLKVENEETGEGQAPSTRISARLWSSAGLTPAASR